MLYAILNTKTGRLLKVEAERQTRHYDYEPPFETAVLRIYDYPYEVGIVYVTENKGDVYRLVKPPPPNPRYKNRYPEIYIDCRDLTLKDLKVVRFVEKKPGGKRIKKIKGG